MPTRSLLPLTVSAFGVLLAGCETAAGVSEDALRLASFNRIQATPFTDRLDAKDCRESLDQMFGFPRSSLDVKHGVQISQAYSCDGKTVLAQVTLKNLNDQPMYCAAFTESAETGAWVGPRGVAMFEYAFNETRNYDCFDER